MGSWGKALILSLARTSPRSRARPKHSRLSRLPVARKQERKAGKTKGGSVYQTNRDASEVQAEELGIAGQQRWKVHSFISVPQKKKKNSQTWTHKKRTESFGSG